MKLLLFFTLVLLSARPLFGQVSFGVKGGFNLANVENDWLYPPKARVAYHVGIASQMELQNNLILRPELQYSVKGFRSPATASNNNATVSLNYVAVPILLGYRTTEKLVLFAGPELGFMTNANSKMGGERYNTFQIYRHFDVGVDLGALYSISKKVAIDLRYNYGSKDLMNTVFTDASGNNIGQAKSGANRVLQLGLYFPL